MILSIQSICKNYKENRALESLSYDFSPGVYGLLGANGAGKSTLMNIITGNLQSSGGTVFYNDRDINHLGRNYRKILGYMPQQQSFYLNFTVLRFLYYMAALKGISKKEAKVQIPGLLSLVNLKEAGKKKIGALSGGMKQRVLLAQAMLGKPQILILDEPTAGLDPKERIRIRNLIAEVAFDKIVIIATHVVSDVEFIAKEIILMKKGKIIGSGSPHLLCKEMEQKVFEIKTTPEKLEEIQSTYQVGNIIKDEENIYVRVISEKSPAHLEYTVQKPSLEDLYLYKFSGNEDLVYGNR